jgi:hypothetical protein
MLHSSLNRFLVLFLISTLIFILAGATSVAQEKTKTAGTMTMAVTKDKTVTVCEADKHTISLAVYDGFNVSTGKQKFMDGAQLTNMSTTDLIKGTGTHQGYARITKGEDSILAKWNGNITTILSEEGLPHISFEGTYSWISGTGQYENIQGVGTYKGKFLSKTIVTTDWEGEYYLNPAGEE